MALYLFIMKKSFPRSAVCAAVLSLASTGQPVLAQSQLTLKEVIVTGNPLGVTELITPSAQVSGAELSLRGKSTLGETLDGLPGVSSTYFGPNASRPIIRGLDGDRIRVLQNSGSTMDASALSFDHAVPSDPISIERIEVLRGAGALQYGGSAVGGVVNVIDNRIPSASQFDEKGGVSGKADVGYATGNREKSAAVLLEAGTNRYALHADVSARKSSDVAIPATLNCTNPATPGPAKKICNSANEVRGGAVGGSVFFEQGYLGVSMSSYKSDYGTVAEDAVTIGMTSNRYALEGEWRNLGGFIRSVKGQLGHSAYQHTEFDAGVAGTVFKNKGTDLRLVARHAAVGPFDGVVGLQTEVSRFSADGAEAFAPHSTTSQAALFVVEEVAASWGKLSLGARTEKVTVTSMGNARAATPDSFPPGRRSFNPGSLALGALVKLAPAWQLTSNLSHTQRAPRDYELYANGPHLATAAWETGNSALGLENATSLDLGLAFKQGTHQFAINAYTSRFANFIGLDATGNRRGADGERNPVDANGDGVADTSGENILADNAYRGVRARFTGLEASGTLRLVGRGGLLVDAFRSGTAQTVDVNLRADVVNATNVSTGQALPRIAPMRVGATVVWGSGPWGARLGADHALAQNRVPDVGQRATDAYTLWHAAVTYKMKQGGADLLWYARLDNITDKLAYSATSVLTTTAFPKAPLPGRSLKVGLQVNF